MNNGCICCTVRKDLLRTFHSLFSDEAFSKLEWIVIETTGLADPAPLIQSLYMDDKCAERMRLDAVLTVVDSKHLPIHIKSSNNGEKGAHGGVPEAVQQLAFADRILLNKIDLVTDEELQAVVASVVGINPTAQMITCAHSQVPLEEILNIKAFDATRNKALLNAEAATEEPKLIQVCREGGGNISPINKIGTSTCSGLITYFVALCVWWIRLVTLAGGQDWEDFVPKDILRETTDTSQCHQQLWYFLLLHR